MENRDLVKNEIDFNSRLAKVLAKLEKAIEKKDTFAISALTGYSQGLLLGRKYLLEVRLEKSTDKALE
jgi:hypothetical protein